MGNNEGEVIPFGRGVMIRHKAVKPPRGSVKVTTMAQQRKAQSRRKAMVIVAVIAAVLAAGIAIGRVLPF